MLTKEMFFISVAVIYMFMHFQGMQMGISSFKTRSMA